MFLLFVSLIKIAKYFEEVLLCHDIFILIELDLKRIQCLNLEVDAKSIAHR
jgi:hypothetical protein